MIQFLTAGQNLPFTIALAIMMGIAVLEGVFTLLGMGISGVLDAVTPDVPNDSADVSGIERSTALSKLLGWLHIGQIPLLILLVLFLTCFSLTGLIGQWICFSVSGWLLPAPLAAVGSLALSFPLVRFLGSLLRSVLPKDETEAVSEASFIGRVATITSGIAQKGKPAEARLQDSFRQTHYILVEPDTEGSQFQSGDLVLIINRQGNTFTAIPNPNPSLTDTL